MITGKSDVLRIKYGIELLEIVRTVHSRQVVHGMISMHSFVSVEPSGGACSFRLINWRYAYRVTNRDESLFVPGICDNVNTYKWV